MDVPRNEENCSAAGDNGGNASDGNVDRAAGVNGEADINGDSAVGDNGGRASSSAVSETITRFNEPDKDNVYVIGVSAVINANAADAESVDVSGGRAPACITNATSRCTDGSEINQLNVSFIGDAPVSNAINRNSVSDNIDSHDERTTYEVTSTDMDEGTLLKCQLPGDNHSSDDVHPSASENRIVKSSGDVISAAGSDGQEESMAVMSSNITHAMSNSPFINVQCADDNAVKMSSQTVSKENENERCYQRINNSADLCTQPAQTSSHRQRNHRHRSSQRNNNSDSASSDTEQLTSCRSTMRRYTAPSRNCQNSSANNTGRRKRNRTHRSSECGSEAQNINRIKRPRSSQAETRAVSYCQKSSDESEKSSGQLTITSTKSLEEDDIRAWCRQHARCTATYICPLHDGCVLPKSVITLGKPVCKSQLT